METINNIPTPPPPQKQEDYSFFKYAIVVVLVGLLWAVLQIVDVQVDDRESYMQETLDEVGNTWSSDQILGAPVITYDRVSYDSLTVKSSKGRDSLVLKKKEETFALYPEVLDIKCNVDSKTLHRAIYDVSVYSANAAFSGNFNIPDNFFDGSVKNVRARMSVSDLKGIFEQVNLEMDTAKYQLSPDFVKSSGTVDDSDIYDAIEEVRSISSGKKKDKKDRKTSLRDVKMSSAITLSKGLSKVPFKLDLAIKGSNSLSFYPVGDATTVEVKSTYNNPSFKGDFLPIDRTVDEKGFSALWKVLKINRSNPYEVTFGVDLIQPVTQYQKTSRSIKYGILVILLVFLAAIVVELFTKKKINILQYAVVGLSLVLFYLLLLSFSDFLSFGLSYLIATVMTTIALTAYFKGILKHKAAYILGALVFVFLLITFVLMQMQVYSLLTGSLLLFVILCVIMYLTRNMSSKKEESPETIENKQ
ncbi:MAG: inner membrane CreD family protein [Bacteroidales bacterium]|nr:inner membrane CreD family protein [Bacteroidales bacterium]